MFDRVLRRYKDEPIGRKSHSLTLMTALAASLFAFPVLAEPVEDYALVAEDKLDIRIVDWRSGEGEYKEWEALGGTYRVDAGGKVQIPLVGEIDAAGETTAELAKAIAAHLAKRSSTGTPPFVTVAISEYGPVYVTGEVEKPGQYTYSPDLTVMKAVSLAGGLRRVNDTAEGRAEREQIQSARSLKDAQIDWSSLLVRQARLRSELSAEDRTFSVPDRLSGTAGIDQIVEEERSLQKLRLTEFSGKLDAAKSLRALYAEEIQALIAKIGTQEQQIAIADKELSDVSSLVKRGLTVSSREFGLQRIVVEAQSQLLDLRVALTRARASQEQAERSLTDLANERNSAIQTELNLIAMELRKAELAMRIAGLMMDESAYYAARLGTEEGESEGRWIQYRITRRGADGEQAVVAAEPQTLVGPRDLVEVLVSPTIAAKPDRARISRDERKPGERNSSHVPTPTLRDSG
ncbi:polysaccharide biosynthesis/export family protein [Fulvimarina sp. MAC3]|uniref:polysaccharide biosynthesis/export family protein n=1 Tax=Fulvimarina sp. MAC3 TaxID=3148887 RepID=UPI0031FD80E9